MADLFRIDPAPVFTVPVTLTGAGGVTATLDITFRHQTRPAFRAWMERVRGAPDGSEADILMEIVAGWVATEPFSRDALDRLLANWYLAKNELMTAYVDGLYGARQKN